MLHGQDKNFKEAEARQISTNPMARFKNFKEAVVLFGIEASKFWQGEKFCFLF